MNVAALNAMTPDELAATFERCCGAHRWVEAMVRSAPFLDEAAVRESADAAFGSLKDTDWLEAFAHHPRIGDVARLRERFAASGHLSEKEQGSAMATANEAQVDRLFQQNQAYEARHGHVFIVCASGKSATEMLTLLEARIDLDRETDLTNCAAEQMKITHLRLGAL